MKLPPRLQFLIGFISILIILGFGYYLEFFKGVNPCPLCILQRLTFAIIGIIFVFGAALSLKRLGRIIVLLLAALASILGMLLSGRQVWLQHLPASQIDCGASLHYLLQVLPWDQALTKVLQGSAECSVMGWEYLGLSLAVWSFLCFMGYFIMASLGMFYHGKSE